MTEDGKIKQPEVPQLRLLSLHEIIRLRRKIYEACELSIGSELKGRLLKKLASKLAKELDERTPMDSEFGIPDYGIDEALVESLQVLGGGEVLTRDLLRKVSAVLAGNIDYIRMGRPCQRWEGQRTEEWVLADVKEAYKYRTSKTGATGALVKFAILSGSPTGLAFTQFMPSFVINTIAVDVGAKGKYSDKWVHYRDIVGMKMLLFLVPGDQLKLAHYNAKRISLAKRNKDLYAHRGPKRVCPNNYKWACVHCPIGYINCDLGTHEEDFIMRDCSRIPPHPGWFDPGRPNDKYCLECVARRERRYMD